MCILHSHKISNNTSALQYVGCYHLGLSYSPYCCVGYVLRIVKYQTHNHIYVTQVGHRAG